MALICQFNNYSVTQSRETVASSSIIHPTWPLPSLLPFLQPHQPHPRKYICSASVPPASRWGGWPRPQTASTVRLLATPWPTKHSRERTRNATRSQGLVLISPATFWRTWRSGRSIWCGWGLTQMLGQVQRALQLKSEPRKMVCWWFHGKHSN